MRFPSVSLRTLDVADLHRRCPRVSAHLALSCTPCDSPVTTHGGVQSRFRADRFGEAKPRPVKHAPAGVDPGVDGGGNDQDIRERDWQQRRPTYGRDPMAYEVPVALIGGGTGLVTGAIGSLFAPWANWGVEKRRSRQQCRAERIKEWREGIAELRYAEQESTPRRPEGHLAFVTSAEIANPNLTTKSWWTTLKPELSRGAHKKLSSLTSQSLANRQGKVPDLLEREIARIERDKWKLI